MTTYKCKDCGVIWSKGLSRDMRYDLSCYACMEKEFLKDGWLEEAYNEAHEKLWTDVHPTGEPHHVGKELVVEGVLYHVISSEADPNTKKLTTILQEITQ